MTRSLQGQADRGQTRAAVRSGRTNRRAGFSLLELIAVVTILGIIAAVVIPRITSSATTAGQQADQQSAAEMRSALERYRFDTGAYPTGTDAAAAATTLVTDGYLHSEPVWQEHTAAYASGKVTLTPN
ncbi:type II secretion system protein [Alienimonas chondri]|uniref:Prepilin-type N-terminal cleavage/methylation domain-containing protein n=1 Tax=Alienimonas chondri TaxID=2681879 RepID=A0ABX1VEE8_9PLAN|nr:prepilin-type N-terminal cleavage/methylation domain-containing protein [Alienimonas chondri]NNJ26265.1 hypothetical protein [Alienimonas chondri]